MISRSELNAINNFVQYADKLEAVLVEKGNHTITITRHEKGTSMAYLQVDWKHIKPIIESFLMETKTRLKELGYVYENDEE